MMIENKINQYQNMPRIYKYEITGDTKYWSKQLKKIDKKLTERDYDLLREVRSEIKDNEAIIRISERAKQDGLIIPCLSSLVGGDCLFESIELAGFCQNRKLFRKCIAILFFLFGDLKIISSYDMSLKEVFLLHNDIEYVFCHRKKLLYKYSYYTMCSDMFSGGSWSRMPTELMLMVVSVFFKVRFHVYHDRGHISKICDVEIDKTIPLDDPESNIYIGLIGEHHYIPLTKKINDDIDDVVPTYNVEIKRFHKWAKYRADLIGLYEIVDDNEHKEDMNLEINLKTDQDDGDSKQIEKTELFDQSKNEIQIDPIKKFVYFN
jgi:hypothetical protein